MLQSILARDSYYIEFGGYVQNMLVLEVDLEKCRKTPKKMGRKLNDILHEIIMKDAKKTQLKEE